jgi:hypothetical protein
LALQLWLSSLQRMDPVKEASQLIEELARETNQSVASEGLLGDELSRFGHGPLLRICEQSVRVATGRSHKGGL